MNGPRLMVINAHPDDAEFTCASTLLQAVRRGWEVREVLMTSDEYGTKVDEFKGERIRRIRKNEMVQAALEYGTRPDGSPLIELVWFGEIDGHLRFTKPVLDRLTAMIEEFSPHVVIAPDGFLSMDHHVDHDRTGWLVYIAIKRMVPAKRPVLLLYHSYNCNFFIPIKEMSIQWRAWAKHRSQTKPFFNKLIVPLRKFFYTARMIKTGPAMAEGFRRVSFEPCENVPTKLVHRVIRTFFTRGGMKEPHRRYRPTPAQLGLSPSWDTGNYSL